MTYTLWKLIHLLGLTLIAGGLMGVLVSDMRSRQLQVLATFAEVVLNIAVFYDGLVVPGAILLGISGIALIHEVHGGWQSLQEPWVAGMVGLFLFEFIEGNTITRIYFMRLRRLTQAALPGGVFTPALQSARAERLSTFTHFLDLPMLLLIVTLGVVRPDTWDLFLAGSALALLIAGTLTILIPRMYPWRHAID